MSEITIDDFKKVDIRIGRVTSANVLEESDKLIKLEVDFGEKGKKTIFAGVQKWYGEEDLEGKLLTFVFNLEPRKMMGDESQGMLLAAESEDGETCALLQPNQEVSPGTRII